MDDHILVSAFRAHSAGQKMFTRRMVITIADMLNATPKAVVVRLEQLDLIKGGSWDWFLANGGITKAHIDEVRAAVALSALEERGS